MIAEEQRMGQVGSGRHDGPADYLRTRVVGLLFVWPAAPFFGVFFFFSQFYTH